MKRRDCARVLIVDGDAILLLQYDDMAPADPFRPTLLTYWVPPGGGVKAGETFEAAACRETAEETGLKIDLGPCVWIREIQLIHGADLKLQHERYFRATATARSPIRNSTSEAIVRHKWVNELRDLGLGRGCSSAGPQDPRERTRGERPATRSYQADRIEPA